jgi:hypothetical protein
MDWENAQTRDAWDYFDAPEHQKYTRHYVQEALGHVLAGKIQLTGRTILTPEGVQETPAEKLNLSQTALSLLATKLDRSFGADAPEHVYNLGTWAGHMALSAALAVNWRQIADRLLRKHTLEYVPGDTE